MYMCMCMSMHMHMHMSLEIDRITKAFGNWLLCALKSVLAGRPYVPC